MQDITHVSRNRGIFGVCMYVCFMMRRMCFDDILNICITSIVAFTNFCATADDIRTVHSIIASDECMYIIMYACMCVGIICIMYACGTLWVCMNVCMYNIISCFQLLYISYNVYRAYTVSVYWVLGCCILVINGPKVKVLKM